jgi:hypothetical protein
MIDGKFDVVFRGQITKNHSVDDVKASLVKLFKSSPEAIERLFTGAEVPIRKSLDYSEAMKYQSALKNVGALALIKEVEVDKPQETPQVTSADTSAKSVETQASTTTAESAEPESVQTPSSPDSSNQTQDSTEGGLTMAAAGEQIMPDKVYEKRDVDTSSLSLAGAGERILPEKPPESHPQPSIDHLSLQDD